MTAVQNSEKTPPVISKFLQCRSQINTQEEGILMISYIKIFTIYWVSLSILENTVSSLLSMALASLIQPYKKIGFHISLLCTEQAS